MKMEIKLTETEVKAILIAHANENFFPADISNDNGEDYDVTVFFNYGEATIRVTEKAKPEMVVVDDEVQA